MGKKRGLHLGNQPDRLRPAAALWVETQISESGNFIIAVDGVGAGSVEWWGRMM